MQKSAAVALGCVLSLLTVTMVHAESAPVYDAETLESQFQSSLEQNNTDLPMPPPPEQEWPTQQAHASRGQAASIENQFVESPSPPVRIVQADRSGHSPDDRLRRVEQQVRNLQNTSSIQQLNALQSEVQALRGQVETLAHQLQQVSNQQQSLLKDVDQRFNQVTSSKPIATNMVPTSLSTPTESSTPAVSSKNTKVIASSQKKTLINKLIPATVTTTHASAAVGVTASGAGESLNKQPNVAEEQQIYQTAYTLIKAKKYNEAIIALQKMLKKYPTGQFASNAHYWLGELYGLLNKNAQALNEFNIVIKHYPHSPRVSDAQLKVGLIHAAQFHWHSAKLAFKQVINHYPGSASSRIANEQLKQIKQAGH